MNRRNTGLSLMVIVAGLGLAAIAAHTRSNGQDRKSSTTAIPRDGDIVFQYSGSAQCPAIAQATHSPYTHCGVVFIEDGEPMVWEAVGPVKKTPYAEWVVHGVNGFAVVRRLKDATPLTRSSLSAMRAEGEREMGKPYDIFFNMEDERIYCSELVWKIYQRGAHITVGTIERFGDMDFSGPDAKRVLKDRFGDRFPADQQVITPASMFASPLLMTVDSVGVPPAWNWRN